MKTKESTSSRGAGCDSVLLKKAHYLLSLIVCTIIWVAGVAFTALATAYPSYFGLKSTIGNVSDFYTLKVTPAGYTFAIWGLIYLWQAAWILYAWTFVLRPKTIPTIPSSCLWLYALANIFPPVWTVLWCNFLPIPSLPALMGTAFIQYFALERGYSHFKSNADSFSKTDTFLTRLLVHNGITLYTTWVSIAWQLNLGVVLQYSLGADPTLTGGVILTSTAVQLVVYFILEQTAFRQALKYTNTVYPVVVWATAGICIAHRNNPSDPLNVFALLLCLLSALFQLLHIGFSMICSSKGSSEKTQTKEMALSNSTLKDEQMLLAL